MQGQPEVEDFLGLPTDEESYNELKALFTLGRPSASGTHYLIPDTFPGRFTVTCHTKRHIIASHKTNPEDVTAECLALLLRIGQIQGSNLGWETAIATSS